ncbi:hypothetical protein Nmel_004790, partial [Mimus melanotis]
MREAEMCGGNHVEADLCSPWHTFCSCRVPGTIGFAKPKHKAVQLGLHRFQAADAEKCLEGAMFWQSGVLLGMPFVVAVSIENRYARLNLNTSHKPNPSQSSKTCTELEQLKLLRLEPKRKVWKKPCCNNAVLPSACLFKLQNLWSSRLCVFLNPNP